MSLDAGMVQMVADAFDETYDDAIAAGPSSEIARREGLTEDEAARAGIEALNLTREEEDRAPPVLGF